MDGLDDDGDEGMEMARIESGCIISAQVTDTIGGLGAIIETVISLA